MKKKYKKILFHIYAKALPNVNLTKTLPLFCFSLFAATGAAASQMYASTGTPSHSPTEAKSGYPYFGQISGMEAGVMCGRVH